MTAERGSLLTSTVATCTPFPAAPRNSPHALSKPAVDEQIRQRMEQTDRLRQESEATSPVRKTLLESGLL